MQRLAVARRYARALADVAGGRDPGRLDKVAVDLSLAAEVLGHDPRLTRFFSDPSVPRQEKDATIDTLVRKAKIGEITRGFLGVLIENRRLTSLAAIARAFEAVRDERLGIVAVEAATAVPLSAADLKRLRASLQTMTGRDVRLRHSVEPDLLGGARTRIGSKVYDGTLRRQLEILRARLAATH
ncbi:MAG TPA: ATP synthase F1 subunit delta [Candidatus Polarisedimenticolia bacterium]|nr:ATP synthase F1 subunit delta [Candidatus Polarisedimenticolia bacterium]